MTEEIRELAGRYEQVSYLLSDPAVLADAAKLKALMREHKSLSMILEAEKEEAAATEALARAKAELSDLRQSGDVELITLAEDELSHAEETLHMAQERLALLLVPKDPDDDKSVIMEIRAGTGGEEAALFAGDLYRMYSMYAASVGLRLSLADSNETELGGYKYISFLLEGEGAFARFKFESGTHRVQRVPVTDSQGKLQTSAVTVAVLPEAEEVDLKILPGDLDIDTCKSSGAGGQHINKTESAVRVTHKPSGIVVECRSERSQLQNKEQALRILRSKLYEIACREQQQKIADTRREQVGSGDRSAKIRTYNYPQNRVTDHRIGFTLYSLDAFLDGAMQPMIDALAAADAAEKRKNKETQV